MTFGPHDQDSGQDLTCKVFILYIVYCINIIIIIVIIIIIIIIIIIKNYSISHLARLHIAALINFRVSNLDTSKDEAARHLHPIPFNPLDYEDRGRLTNDGTLHDGRKRNS